MSLPLRKVCHHLLGRRVRTRLKVDGHARDVTLRYTRNFGAKTIKLRPPIRKDEPDWWATVVGFLERPYRLVSRMF